MKALILAGGFGTRLRPLTYTSPKHLLPIVNRPHIEHVFDLLQRHRIDEVVLLTSYLAEAFAPTVHAASTRGLKVEVTHEREPLGTAGALRNAADLAGETVVALNGDILTTFDLTAVIETHRTRGAAASIVLTPVEDPSAFGVVPTGADGKVLGFIEKPSPGTAPTNLVNAGIYVLEPEVIERIPEGRAVSAERELFPALVADDAGLYAVPGDGYWIDIGTPEKYLQANLDVISGAWTPASGRAVDESSVVAGDARVSSSCLGPGATVDEGAVVERSVLLAGAGIGSGARVTDSILGAGARVAPGATIHGVTLGDGEEAR